MEIFSGKIEGDEIMQRDLRLLGMITGSATVNSGVSLELSGMVIGDLIVDEGATVELHGMVGGDVTNKGGRLNVYGMIQGRLFKSSGETHVDAKAVIAGGIQ